MKNTFAIMKKELRHFFYSPLAYIIMAVFLGICSFFFQGGLSAYVQYSMNPMDAYGQPIELNLNVHLFQGFI
ncbi:MAG: hypothetical protein ACOCWO_03075, partial [Candidatus Muiribacteriaceae bacterium]